jgi:uncharacterized membrane protein YdfJ with MMPL/SSD domain
MSASDTIVHVRLDAKTKGQQLLLPVRAHTLKRVELSVGLGDSSGNDTHGKSVFGSQYESTHRPVHHSQSATDEALYQQMAAMGAQLAAIQATQESCLQEVQEVALVQTATSPQGSGLETSSAGVQPTQELHAREARASRVTQLKVAVERWHLARRRRWLISVLQQWRLWRRSCAAAARAARRRERRQLWHLWLVWTHECSRASARACNEILQALRAHATALQDLRKLDREALDQSEATVTKLRAEMALLKSEAAKLIAQCRISDT